MKSIAVIILAMAATAASASNADPCAPLVELQRKQAEAGKPQKAVEVALAKCREKQAQPKREQPKGVKLWD